jgi:hypothetical protein
LKRFAFQVAPQEEITSRQIGRTGWPRNVAISGDYVMLKQFLRRSSTAEQYVLLLHLGTGWWQGQCHDGVTLETTLIH